MKSSEGEPRNGLEEKAFLWLVIAVSVLFAWIITPMYGAILWGVVIAILFAGIHKGILSKIKRPNLAAFVTLGLILLVVILPLAVLSIAVAGEASEVYDKIKSGDLNIGRLFQKVLDAMPGYIMGWLDRFGVASFSDLKNRLAEGVSQISQVVVAQAISLGQHTFGFLLSVFVMLYLLFFLLRDGQEIFAVIRRAVPLKPEHKEVLFDRFSVVVRAMIKGNLVVSILQGGLGGLIFWILGVQGALLWGALMAVLSLLPAVGAAMIWLPVALYLLATGAVWKGVVLLVFGVVVISLVDNLVRPMLVGKDTKMPDFVVLISTLGGIAVLGVNGFVVGPLVAAMFITVWEIYSKNRALDARVRL